MRIDGFIKAVHQINKIHYRPILLSKIARGYFRTLVLRKATLRICEFSITPSCQSECRYCYAAKFTKEGQKLLSLEEIKSVWEQAKKLGAFSSVVFGGEPLLHPQFLDIIKILEPKKHIVTFTTNAIALTEDLVVKLKRLGVFLVNISINSLNSEINDKIRGYKGHLNKALSAVEICKKHGLDVFLPVTTSKPLLKETLEIVNYAQRNDLGVTINLMCPMGRAEGMHDQLFDEEFWVVLRRLYNSNPNLRSDYDVNLDMRIGCPAGFEKIHIGPYGDVTGCSMQPESFGNIREESLGRIVHKMRSFHHYKKRSPQCIIAVDHEYISDYMNFASNYKSLPYPVEENPNYRRDKGPSKTEKLSDED